METCSLGRWEEKNGQEVHCKGSLRTREEIGESDVQLIRWRSGVKRHKKTICQAHFDKYLKNYCYHQKLCCNPLSTHCDHSTAKGKIEITRIIRTKGLALGLKLIPGQKMCVKCKIALFKTADSTPPVPIEESSPSVLFSSQTGSVVASQDPPVESTPSAQTPQGVDKVSPIAPYMVNLMPLNEFLVQNQEDALDLVKLKHHKQYSIDVLNNVWAILQRFKGQSENPFEPDSESVQSWVSKSALFDEMLEQLQKYFQECASRAERIHALTVLPRSWPLREIKEKFNVSTRTVTKVKRLVETKGILSTPNKKVGRPLDDETKKAVVDFFYRSDVSKELTGKNSVICVRENGKKVHKNKRFVLANLSHLHAEFVQLHPDLKVSLSKFAFLRPRDCILSDSSGMHNVCVCIAHENPKLMFEGASLQTLTDFQKATDCCKLLLCDAPSDACYLRECIECPDSSGLREKLGMAFEEELIDSVTFNQWESTDRSNIVTKTCSVEDFIEDFIVKTESLVKHHFILKRQTSFFKELQKNIAVNEAIIIGDFAENFTFIVQDSVQSFYFANKQATIHPFSCYYRNPETNAVEHLSFAVISDHMDHSTVAVYAFQKELINALKPFIPNLAKVFWFSDGCAEQYKNKKNAANVYFFYQDFQIVAEWHFFASGHGRSPCDGIGGCIKRFASLYCLKNTQPGSQITTAKRLYEWALTGITGVHCLWVPAADVENARRFLEVRFQTAKSLDGIRSAHCILPCPDKNVVILKKLSGAATGEEHDISTAEMTIKFEDVKGYVTICQKNESCWQLAYVQDKDEEAFTVSLVLLAKKAGGKKNQYYFAQETTRTYPLDCILTLPQPKILSKGQTVKLLASDVIAADTLLKKRIEMQRS